MKKVSAAATSIIVALGCYTYVQLKDAECKVYCKTSAGYDSGIFVGDRCWCADKISDEKIQNKILVAPSKQIKGKNFVYGD